MKKSLLIASVAAVCLLGGCKDKKNMDNPFFAQWGTPYEIPDFGKIKPEHYMPAFEEGMKQQKEEIAAILNNTEAPTFENTIAALALVEADSLLGWECKNGYMGGRERIVWKLRQMEDRYGTGKAKMNTFEKMKGK